MRVKLRVGCAVLALALAALLLRNRRGLSHAALGAAALLSLAHYLNFGHFHQPQLPHYWELFHYALGSRYFPELGYDGLYLASLAAERESRPGRAPQRELRDLRNNALVPSETLRGEEARVRARFSEPRWRAFQRDHGAFLRLVPPEALAQFRRDHGYNPSPAWTAVARVAMAGRPLDEASLRLLASLDLALLAALFAALARCFDLRTALFAALLFGTGYLGRFSWTGGALLRHDWIAAVGFGACALRRGRPALAGLCLGYAAAVRLFPAALFVGPGLVALRQALAGERPRWALSLALGSAAALALAFAAGSLQGRGPGAWRELASRMQVYQLSRGRNVVGLDGVVLYGGDALSRALRADTAGARWDVAREDVALRRRVRAPLLLAARLGLLALLAAAVWRARPEQAVVLSCAAIFALVAPAGYYWSVLCLAPVAVGAPLLIGQLALDLGLHRLHLGVPDRLLHSTLAASGLLVLFVAWLLPPAWRALRTRPRARESSAGALR